MEYELVGRDGKLVEINYRGQIIANYPKDKLKELESRFKEICSTDDFQDYDSLDDFIDSIYFLEFLEYFLYYLHHFYPNVISYEKNKNKMSKDELFVIDNIYFKKLIHYAYRYLFFSENIEILLNEVKSEYEKFSKKISMFKPKEAQLLIELYNGFLYFLELHPHTRNHDYGIDLLVMLKNNIMKGKLNKTKTTFNQSKLSETFEILKMERIMKHRKDLLYKFKLFQRKCLSEIAKLRHIGSPMNSNEESKKLKKELNKNKNIDYGSNKIYHKYVLEKMDDESIYDYLAGIHKNSSGEIIHKDFNNENVKRMKINTKKKHHESYVENSLKILEIVEEKIKNNGNIIPKSIQSNVIRIRKLFNSKEYKNTNISTFSFGNITNNTNIFGIGGKIIQDCKTIRALNKEIDNLIKQHQKMSKQKLIVHKTELINEDKNFLSNLVSQHPNIQTLTNNKKKIHKLLLKYHPNKLVTLPENQQKKGEEIAKKLINILNKL